jgi:hypothetical protein
MLSLLCYQQNKFDNQQHPMSGTRTVGFRVYGERFAAISFCVPELDSSKADFQNLGVNGRSVPKVAIPYNFIRLFIEIAPVSSA